jgi:hypothetical protein
VPWIRWAIAPPETTIVTGPSPDPTDLSYDEEIELPTEPQPAVSIAQRRAARARTRIGEPGRAPHPGRPARIRAADGSGELPVACYELFSGTEVLGRMALDGCCRALDAALPGRAGGGRHPHRADRHRHQPLGGITAIRRRDRDRAGRSAGPRICPGLDLVALMVDGVHFGEHTCVVALGIDIDGVKHRSRARPRTPPWSPS